MTDILMPALSPTMEEGVLAKWHVKVGDTVRVKVILVDDLIATGGTAEGAVKLLQQMGAEVVAACFIVDLPDLGGRKKIEALGVPVRTLIEFEGD